MSETLPADHPAISDVEMLYGKLDNVTNKFILDNFLKVELAFSSTVVKSIRAKGLETIFSLLAELGGAFGFWIGFSVITFIELVEWWIRMGVSCCSSRKVKPSSESETSVISKNLEKTEQDITTAAL